MSSYDALAASYDGLMADGVYRRRADYLEKLFRKSAIPVKTVLDLACGTGTISCLLAAKGYDVTATDLSAEMLTQAMYKAAALEKPPFFLQQSMPKLHLLEPVDAAKYDSFSLRDFARWGLVAPVGCTLAQKAAVRREDLCSVPLMIHRRAGLQLEIARWAQTEPERLHVVATYNVVDGNPAAFVRSGLGYYLTSEDHLAANLDPDVCFRPLEPPLEICHALVWKRYPVFSKAAEAFLKCL